jgi:hypothetical protein
MAAGIFLKSVKMKGNFTIFFDLRLFQISMILIGHELKKGKKHFVEKKNA